MWSITNINKIIQELMPRAICFYPRRASRSVIKRLLLEREPTNFSNHPRTHLKQMDMFGRLVFIRFQ